MHIIKQICNELEKQNIKYCHFKSNQHLDKSFNGDTDFDILIDGNKKTEIDIIFSQFNCKRFSPVGIGIYPGVEDWYVFDKNSGKMFHIHLHYQLATGKQYVKEYILPWNKLVLESAIKDEKYNIFISNPNVEIVLLITRMVVKSKLRDKLKAKIGGYKTHISLQKEFEYLKRRINLNELINYLNIMYSPNETKELLEIIKQNKLTSKNYRKLYKIVIVSLENNKRMRSIKAFYLALLFKILTKYKRLGYRLNKLNIIRKTTVSGGKIVCFIGVDGSGKSTLTKDLNKWLMKGKVENTKVYMGSGDGEKPLLSTIISFFRKKKSQKEINNKVRHDVTKNPDTVSPKISPLKYINIFIRALENYSIAKSNRKKIIKMHRYKLNGGISIVDRFPQLEQTGINDGLKIENSAKKLNSTILRKLSKKEKKALQIVNEIYPDYIFRLNISTEVSMLRKPEENTNYNYIDKKIKSLKSLKYPNSKLYEINAEKDYNEVLLEIKEILWNNF